MKLDSEIEAVLAILAERLSANSSATDGFAVPAEPVGLRTTLTAFEDRLFDEYDNEWGFPWSLEISALLSMQWELRMPGGGSFWSVCSLCLPSGRRLYVQEDDRADQPVILAVTKGEGTPQQDRGFLQRLMRDNGASLGTGLFGSPPDSISTCVNSFPFLVDLIVAGFDAAGEECWEALLDGWDVWDEEYENPTDPMKVSAEILREAEQEDIRRHGQPGSMITGHAHSARACDAAYETMTRDEIDEFLLVERFRSRSPREPEARIQIVARYLNQVLST